MPSVVRQKCGKTEAFNRNRQLFLTSKDNNWKSHKRNYHYRSSELRYWLIKCSIKKLRELGHYLFTFEETQSQSGKFTKTESRFAKEEKGIRKKYSATFRRISRTSNADFVRATEFKEKKSNANFELRRAMRSEGTRSWGLVFTHELQPDTGDEGGNIDPGVTHTRSHTIIHTHAHPYIRERALLRGRERSV